MPSPASSHSSRASTGRSKVIYFVVSHVHPPQIVRLAQALRTGGGDSRVVIHHDYNVSDLDPAAFRGLDHVDLLRPGLPVRYATFATCRIILWCLDWMIRYRDFDWVVYLSGQDYPIKPPVQIERDLAATACDGFLDAQAVDDAPWFLGAERYLYRYTEVPRIPYWPRVRKFLHRRAVEAVARGDRAPRFNVPHDSYGHHKLGVRPLDGPFRDGFRCFVGSAWWTLSRASVQYILDSVRRNPGLAGHYQRVLFAPNESYFLTILLNNPQLRLIANDDKRFVRWSNASSGHPDLLGANDFHALAGSSDHFARKIDQRTAPELLDRLDRHIRAAEPDHA